MEFMKDETETILFKKLDEQVKITNQILVNQGVTNEQTKTNTGNIKTISGRMWGLLITMVLQLLAIVGALVLFILNYMKDN